MAIFSAQPLPLLMLADGWFVLVVAKLITIEKQLSNGKVKSWNAVFLLWHSYSISMKHKLYVLDGEVDDMHRIMNKKPGRIYKKQNVYSISVLYVLVTYVCNFS